MQDASAKKGTVVSLPSRTRSRGGNSDTRSSSLKLAGSLAGFNLADVVQLVIATKKTGLLAVTSKCLESLLYFEKGRVIHAENDEAQGEEVAYLFFIPQVGSFEFSADVLPEVRSLDIDGTFFLMEAMRRCDEVDRGAPKDSSRAGEVHLSLDRDGDELFGDNFSVDHLGGDDKGGPKLSLITNETVLELDLYKGADDGAEQTVSLSDDLVEALLAHSAGDESDEQVDAEHDVVALGLAKVNWIASFNMFSQNGFPLIEQEARGASKLGEVGVATVSILEFSEGLGSLLGAGELEYAFVTEKNNSKAILADVEGRYVSARLKPGSPTKKLITKMLAGLTVASSK